jgi:hypothetical protein
VLADCILKSFTTIIVVRDGRSPMNDQELKIAFEGAEPADAARFAHELEEQLREADPSATISI